jgi:hypothetical protein
MFIRIKRSRLAPRLSGLFEEPRVFRPVRRPATAKTPIQNAKISHFVHLRRQAGQTLP